MKCCIKKKVVSLLLVVVMLLSYFPVMVGATESATDIKAIQKPTGISIVEDYDDYFGADWLEKLELPKFVTVTLANNITTEAPVTWDASTLDTRTTGYYSLPGTVALPAGVTNGQNLTVTITVQVREYKNLVANPGFEEGTKNWRLRGNSGSKYIQNDYVHSGESAFAMGEYSTNSTNNIEFFNLDETDLANRAQAMGAGQYFFGVYVRQAPNPASDIRNFSLTLDQGKSNSTVTGGKSNVLASVSDDTFQQVKGIATLTGEETKLRLIAAATKDMAITWDRTKLRFDDVELVPLKVALVTEPSPVKEIKTDILSRKVVLNYPDYVGENWKEELGLPKKVEVVTESGDIAEVDVTWSFADLDFTKYGKYTLVGALDDSSFPNPKGIVVTQNIYVGKASNLFTNPSFEGDLNGWYLRGGDPNPSVVKDPVKDGSYAAMTGTLTTTGKEMSFMDTRRMEAELCAAVEAIGAGQFYFSSWAQYAAQMPEGMQFQMRMYYKAKDKNGTLASSSTVINSEKVAMVNKEYVQAKGIVDLPERTAFTEFVLYVFAKNNGEIAAPIYVDQAELIPINVSIPKDQEPADVEEILDEIPVRAVVQNYNTFVGENWQQALGLPTSVKVRTSTGSIASVDVIWDYAPLNLKKEGKYTLVGTLDNSAYPNPKELYVTQVIHVVEYKNLISNPSFENGLTGWYLRGDNPNRVQSPVKDGKYAAITGTLTTTGKEMSFADTRRMEDALSAAVAEVGAGQFYFGGWAQYSGRLPDGMQLQVRLLYKTIDEDGNLSQKATTLSSDKVALLDKAYSQAMRIVELPANIGFVEIVFYAFTQDAGTINAPIYLDHTELVPLNVIVAQHEGEMVQVETIIPSRQIIQNYPEYIGEGYTPKDLMLPETVDVRSSVGEIIKVGVKWDYSGLDLTKTGTYTLYGRLEDMKLANPNALTVKQTIKVVSKQNIFKNSSFEDDNAGWGNHRHLKLGLGNTSPVRTGSFSLKLETTRMDDWTADYLQAFYNSGEASVGQKITTTGAGRYFFSAWVQGTSTSTDISADLRLYYRCLSTGDQLYTVTAPKTQLTTGKFTQISEITDLPDDIYMAHLDLYLLGTPDQLRLSTLYLDDMELIPLNVEIANLTDIIDCEGTADIYVHEGSTIENLDLPKELQVIIKNGQKFDLGVTWDLDSFDPNKIGVQTITGSLNLGKTYKNPKNFVPTVKIIVRAKGDPLRETIYFSTSGNDANDGLSPEKPKQDIKQMGTYLQQGYDVRLKRGDVWYLPGVNITLKDILGTEKAPLTLGAYGTGEMPVIAFMKKIENSAWKLVDAKRNIYAADVSDLGQKDGVTVHRCFGDGVTYSHRLRSNYAALQSEEYCSYNKTLYLRMPEGTAPKNIVVTPYAAGGHNMNLNNISYLNVEQIHIQGGNPTVSMMFIDAPTKHLRFTYCSITRGYNYHMVWETDDETIHYKPEVSNCYFDAELTEKEGWFASDSGTFSNWNVSAIEGITMRDGVDGAWIHHNHLRNMSHASIAIESTNKANDHTTTGVRNCIVEDNLCEGGYAMYARAFNICGGFNLSDIQMCRDNTFRRNYAYDMTSSSHLFGENNLVYSNVFSFHHMTFNEDGTLFEGKQAMPGAFDTIIYSDHTSVGNMLVNNTFYNCGAAICISDTAHTVYNNIYANNLIVNWSPDVPNYPGAFYDNTIDLNYVMNNCMYSHANYTDHFNVDKTIFSAADVNVSKTGYSDNLYADPLFLTADVSNVDKYARMDFTLSNESPFRYAGLSLYASVYENFPAWERLKAEYTDINGVVYLAESPSIGAYSFCEKIKGDVAEVGKLDDILARPGATFEHLNLPDSVPAVNDQGIDVILLIAWDKAQFDGSKPGTVTLTGELRNGPHTELNINGKTASININIKDKLELVDVITTLKDLTVLYNTSIEEVVAKLPAKLSVVEESGYEEDLPVTWVCEDYNPTKPDSYTFKCVLPDDMVSNAREFPVEVGVRVLHEIARGMELLVNPDFIDGTSAAPWKIGWGTGNFRITQDPQYLMDGEPAAAIVTTSGKYGSIQQDVVGQMQLMGDGKYLFKVYMRAYDITRPIDSTYACLKVWGPKTTVYKCRAANNVGTDWVEFSAVMDVTDLAQATEVSFHTSTGKSDDDIEAPAKSYVITGASLIYLGKTDAEVEATMDSIDLTWNTIKGENESEKNVTSDLTLPTTIGMSSKIKWSSSDESAITNDGKVTMGRAPKTVTLTATITYNGIDTVKIFSVTVPRNPDLPTFSGSLSGSQDVNIGDEFKVVISLTGEKATTFNAYRFTLSFNTTKLEYVGCSDTASAVEVEGGKITISGIGTERPITDTITLTFRAKKSGLTEVRLIRVEMDLAPNASLDNLPSMAVAEGTALIDVQKTDSGEKDDDKTTENPAEEQSVVLWIVIGLVVAVLVAGGVIAVIVIKKKKQAPPATEE
ncbi:MAG: hypothetical protein E7447_05075 [Ruminococcaceae bacterium]|nr:hypothetical protein [Oscillospiraceae bacterium]